MQYVKNVRGRYNSWAGSGCVVEVSTGSVYNRFLRSTAKQHPICYRIGIDSMLPSLTSADREFLERLHRLGDATVKELCVDLSVTATAIRQRIQRLLAQGLIAQTSVHNSRGRPRNRYSLSDAGLRQLGDNYSDLAQFLWQELTQIEDADVRQRILSRLKMQMVERFGRDVHGTSLPDRMDRLRDSLVAHGFDVEVDVDRSGESSLPILRENSCPYHDLAHQDSAICELEQQVYSEILGTEVELTTCCRDGHSCCEFEVQAECHS